ncbi:MAG: hypothetical protein LIO71_09995 [Ruminococcus sp.]|nr:hypothetical protein [Ruminococcus sp.]
MKCPRCKQECDDSVICKYCGTKLNNLSNLNISFNDNIKKVDDGSNNNYVLDEPMPKSNDVSTNYNDDENTILSVSKSKKQNYNNIWDNSKVDDIIHEQNTKKIKQGQTIQIVLLIVIILIIILMGIVVVMDKLSTISNNKQVSNIVNIQGNYTIVFENGKSYDMNSFSKRVNGESFIYESTNGSTVAIIDNNSNLHIYTQDINQTIDDVNYVQISANGDGIVYIKNAIVVSSKYKNGLMAGELCYYNIKDNTNKKIDSNVLNNYITISPNGSTISYLKNYEEKLDKDDSNKDTISFECIVCTDYGTNKSDEAFKGFTDSANNPIILAISDDGNIIYWYDVLSPNLNEYPLYISVKKSKNNKSDNNSNHNVGNDQDSQTLTFTSTCDELLLCKDNATYLLDANGNETKILDEQITSILDVDIINNIAITDTFVGHYFVTEENNLYFMESTDNIKCLSSGNFQDIILSTDKNFFCGKKLNTNSLFRVNTSDLSSENISDNVETFAISNDGLSVYYLEKDGTLYIYEDGLSNVIASQVSENFFLIDDILYYIDDNHLYYYDGSNSTQIDEDNNVVEIYPYTNHVLFKTDKNKLFMIDEKFEISEIQ